MFKTLHTNRKFFLGLFLFVLFRSAVADWNPVPSGSMRPTILEGDVVLVNRLAYDVKVPLTDIIMTHTGEPQRGDIVTFSSPADGTRLIKRIVAVPGDVIEMKNKRLIVNGREESYVQTSAAIENFGGTQVPAVRLTENSGNESHTVQWLPEVAARDNFGPITIPADKYCFLGDNRDNSADSRYIGLVSRNLLNGKASRVVASANITGNWLPRFDRFWHSLY